MEKILQYLEELNLSDTEAKLYLELLKSGPIAVKDLAKAIGIKRTTAYFHIELLIEKGLIVKIVNDSRKQIAATKPEEGIKSLIEQKLESAKNAKTTFPTMLKEIQTRFPSGEGFEDAEVRYYKGKGGVQKIYEEALQSRELRSYFNIELIKEGLPDNEPVFVNALKNNKDLKIYELFQDATFSRAQLNEFETLKVNSGNYFYKFLPSNVKLSAADILIYDGNVAIINTKNQLTGVILQNEDYYNSSKEMFDLVWKLLPEVNFEQKLKETIDNDKEETKRK